MSMVSFSSFLESSLKIHESNGSCRTMYVAFYKSFHVDVSISIEDFLLKMIFPFQDRKMEIDIDVPVGPPPTF